MTHRPSVCLPHTGVYQEAPLDSYGSYARVNEAPQDSSYARANVPRRPVEDLFDNAQQPTHQTPVLRQKTMDPTAVRQMTWTPHQPGEAIHNSKYGTADINTRMYERTVMNGAEEQPYKRHDRLPNFITFLLGEHMAAKSDMYTRPLTGKT